LTPVHLQHKAVVRTFGFHSVVFARNEKMELVENGTGGIWNWWNMSHNKRFKYEPRKGIQNRPITVMF
jgi:hypothetical protein